MRVVAGILICGAAALVAGCGSDGDMDSEDYGNLLASPAGLIVLEEEHPTGYGRPDCLVCHELRSIHVENRTDLPDCSATANPEACIDLDLIRSLVRADKDASCASCHGENGVLP